MDNLDDSSSSAMTPADLLLRYQQLCSAVDDSGSDVYDGPSGCLASADAALAKSTLSDSSAPLFNVAVACKLLLSSCGPKHATPSVCNTPIQLSMKRLFVYPSLVTSLPLHINLLTACIKEHNDPRCIVLCIKTLVALIQAAYFPPNGASPSPLLSEISPIVSIDTPNMLISLILTCHKSPDVTLAAVSALHEIALRHSAEPGSPNKVVEQTIVQKLPVLTRRLEYLVYSDGGTYLEDAVEFIGFVIGCLFERYRAAESGVGAATTAAAAAAAPQPDPAASSGWNPKQPLTPSPTSLSSLILYAQDFLNTFVLPPLLTDFHPASTMCPRLSAARVGLEVYAKLYPCSSSSSSSAGQFLPALVRSLLSLLQRCVDSTSSYGASLAFAPTVGVGRSASSHYFNRQVSAFYSSASSGSGAAASAAHLPPSPVLSGGTLTSHLAASALSLLCRALSLLPPDARTDLLPVALPSAFVGALHLPQSGVRQRLLAKLLLQAITCGGGGGGGEDDEEMGMCVEGSSQLLKKILTTYAVASMLSTKPKPFHPLHEDSFPPPPGAQQQQQQQQQGQQQGGGSSSSGAGADNLDLASEQQRPSGDASMLLGGVGQQQESGDDAGARNSSIGNAEASNWQVPLGPGGAVRWTHFAANKASVNARNFRTGATHVSNAVVYDVVFVVCRSVVVIGVELVSMMRTVLGEDDGSPRRSRKQVERLKERVVEWILCASEVISRCSPCLGWSHGGGGFAYAIDASGFGSSPGSNAQANLRNRMVSAGASPAGAGAPPRSSSGRAAFPGNFHTSCHPSAGCVISLVNVASVSVRLLCLLEGLIAGRNSRATGRSVEIDDGGAPHVFAAREKDGRATRESSSSDVPPNLDLIGAENAAIDRFNDVVSQILDWKIREMGAGFPGR